MRKTHIGVTQEANSNGKGEIPDESSHESECFERPRLPENKNLLPADAQFR